MRPIAEGGRAFGFERLEPQLNCLRKHLVGAGVLMPIGAGSRAISAAISATPWMKSLVAAASCANVCSTRAQISAERLRPDLALAFSSRSANSSGIEAFSCFMKHP